MQHLPAIRNNNLIPTTSEMTAFEAIAHSAVVSKMYKGIGEQAGVMMIMLAARELGISPVMALNGGLNIINGKTEISARMMNAMIRRSGHSIQILESTDQICRIKGKRLDNGDTQETSYSLEEARRAGLIKPGGGWTKNPADMCFARALSRLARQLFADVIGTGYIEGEIQAAEKWNHPFMKEPECMGSTVSPAEQIEISSVEVLDQNTFEVVRDYESLFDFQDLLLALEYKKIVQKHFKWNDDKAHEELVRDPAATVSKFKAWKEKKNATN